MLIKAGRFQSADREFLRVLDFTVQTTSAEQTLACWGKCC